jgi:general secretion pathway protein M
MDAIRNFWSARAPREKLALAAAGTVLVLALLYLVLIEPAFTGLAQLQRSLPQTRAQAARLDALLAEAHALKARPPAAQVPAAQMRTSLDASLAAAGLKAERIVPLSNGDLQLKFVNVPYGRWSAWLAASERDLGAHAVAVDAKAAPAPGDVDVELSLRWVRG